MRTSLAIILTLAAPAMADEIGYEELVARLGSAVPTGAGVQVVQVEANESAGLSYRPNPAEADFAGKSFNLFSGASADSGHATFVGRNLYGSLGMAKGITQINCFDANGWINAYLRFGAGSSGLPLAPTNGSRLFNCSWIGSTTPSQSNEILRRADYAMNRDNTLVIAGMNNGASQAVPELMSCTYNGIAVGLTSGNHSAGSPPSGIDGAGRQKPELVAPGEFTSFSTPIVSASAALLYQFANELPFSLNTNRRTGVAIKAALFAGASHGSTWSNGTPTSGANRGLAPNPIDPILGFGTVNIDRAHRVLSADEVTGQSTLAAAVTAPPVGSIGWDYEVVASTTYERHYPLNITSTSDLSVALTWNRAPTSTSLASGGGATPVYNLDLRLRRVESGQAVDMTGNAGSAWFVGGNVVSAVTTGNIEHLWIQDLVPGRYVISINRATLGAPSSGSVISWIVDPGTTVPGDLNGDGVVDGADLGILLSNWGGSGLGDLNGSGLIDGADLGSLLSAWS
jgi:hypothetical protein